MSADTGRVEASRHRQRLAERSILSVAVITAALVFAALVLGALQFARLERSLALQNRLSDRAFAVDDALLQLVNEETGVRGYVATGDRAFLDIYRASEPRLNRDLAGIDTGSLHFIQGRAVERYLASEIALMDRGRHAQARANLAYGKHLFDRLRLADASLQQRANDARRRQRTNSLLLARVGLAGSAVLAALVAFWALAFGVVVRRSRRDRARAVRDALTGAFNRAGASEVIAQAIRAEQPFAIIFIDLDGFKKINDVYGHAAGDAILKTCAARLLGEVRTGDAVCRFGGDEFVCVIAAPIDVTSIEAAAQRLRRTVAQPYHFDEDQYVVGCSVGVSFYPADGLTAADLLARADVAMYRAKSAGGGIHFAAR